MLCLREVGKAQARQFNKKEAPRSQPTQLSVLSYHFSLTDIRCWAGAPLAYFKVNLLNNGDMWRYR